MKRLELKQMELVEGGLTCVEATGVSLGVGVGLVVAGVLTGGVGFAVGALLWIWGGSAVAAVACLD